MAERCERAAPRLVHRSAAMSAVRMPATTKKTVGRPSWRVAPSRTIADGFGIPRDSLDRADNARRGPLDARSHKFARFGLDARELQSLPPYLPAAGSCQIQVRDRWRYARVRKNAILTAIPHDTEQRAKLARDACSTGESSTTGERRRRRRLHERHGPLPSYTLSAISLGGHKSPDLGYALARTCCQRTLPTTRHRHFVRFSIDNLSRFTRSRTIVCSRESCNVDVGRDRADFCFSSFLIFAREAARRPFLSRRLLSRFEPFRAGPGSMDKEILK